MAFTGTPVVKLISESEVRITGVSLAGSAHGTISLFGGGGDAECPEAFQPKDYVINGETVHLADSIMVVANFVGAVDPDMVPLQVAKTGTTPDNFLITVTNNPNGDGPPATGALEFYLVYHN